MSFFQNVFNQEYQGYLQTGNDRQYSLTFKVKANQNNQDYQFAYNNEPYNLSSNNTLTINYAWDEEYRNWSSLSVNIAGADPANTKSYEIAEILNTNEIFSGMYVASVATNSTKNHLIIKSKSQRAKQIIKMYISNSSAEIELKFNKKAGVAELPTFFTRDTISNRFTFQNNLNHLILLDVSNPIDQAIITEAGFDYNSTQEDWELLRGRGVGIYTFKKQTIDANSRITQIIEYGAGAIEGDLARKTIMSYSGAKTQPDKICEIPHVITSGDLLIP